MNKENKLQINKTAVVNAHKVEMILEIHRKLTASWYELDLIGDDKCKNAIKESLEPIDLLISQLVCPSNV